MHAYIYNLFLEVEERVQKALGVGIEPTEAISGQTA